MPGTFQFRIICGALLSFSLLGQQISVDSLQQLCYASDVSGNWESYRLDLDTLVSINLTQNPDLDAYPSWSPDGQQITFFSSRDGNNEIYTMQADGSHAQRLTNHPAVDKASSWSPTVGF